MLRLIIKGCSIVDAVDDFPEKSDILIVDGVIEEIRQNITAAADMTISADGLKVLPGFIDMHAHLRQPGFEYKETVKSGTIAAVKGGYTGICCMPNTRPVIDDENSLSLLLDIIKRDAVIDVYPIAAITKGQKGQELTDLEGLYKLGAIAFSDDGHPVPGSKLLEAMNNSKDNDLLLIDHCEDLSLVNGGVINFGAEAARLGLKGISNLSEELPIMRDIMLAEAAGARIHIAHISTEKSAEIVKHAKDKGIKVTSEVTPHHIALSDEIIEAGYTDCKVNPPLRTKRDILALKAALKDGTIDVIATDHAPHHESEKGNDFYTAAFGISGIESAFSVCYTELVESGVLSLKELINKMSFKPAQILGIDKGRIREGGAADIVIVDTNSTITVNRNTFESQGKNTPFHGRSYKGEVIYTIKAGKLVYRKI